MSGVPSVVDRPAEERGADDSRGCVPEAVPVQWRLAAWNEAQAETVAEIESPSLREWDAYHRRSVPLVLRGLAREWAATREWTFETVATRVGSRRVPVIKVHDGLLGYGTGKGMDYSDCPFDELVRRACTDVEPRLFLNLNPDRDLPELVADLEQPRYSRKAHWRERRITIGSSDTGTPIHRELPDNIFTVLRGEKEVALFSPEDSPNLYGYGVLSGVPHLCRVDPRRFDPSRFPKLARSRPFHCRLGAGDALFIPRGWWHSVLTLEPSIALGSWWAWGWRSLLPRAAVAYKTLLRVKT